ncbi:MAG TPA: HAD-IIIA family hydrolase [Gemmatimonadaceae bacterium]|nr:HAD-IIIA family hydrolase [Gemmatimonadaceae bacterium]
MPGVIDDVDLIIFDADGTLRRTLVAGQPCPRAPDEWALLPNVRETLARIDWSRIAFALASNQDQVGYGLFSAEMAARLLHDLARAATDGACTHPIVRFCPHRLEIACDCRKPAPGMLRDILRARGTPAARALFVGDAETDRLAAEAAGVRFAWARAFFAQV